MSEQLVEDHWNYIRRVLEISNVSNSEINKIGFHYKTGMAHGYKHGKEDKK